MIKCIFKFFSFFKFTLETQFRKSAKFEVYVYALNSPRVVQTLSCVVIPLYIYPTSIYIKISVINLYYTLLSFYTHKLHKGCKQGCQ